MMLHDRMHVLLSVIVFCVYYVNGAAVDLFRDPYYEDLPLCGTAKDACYTALTINGISIPSSHQNCRCRGGATCTRGEDPSRTISRVLAARGQSMTMQLSYCEPIGNNRVCIGDETALVMSGGGVLPTRIVEGFCKCPDDQPLLLSRTFYPRNTWMVHNEFVCSQRTCPASSSDRTPCKTTTRSATRFGFQYTTRFHCQCPGRHSCVTEPSTGSDFHGYCQRI